MKSEKQTADFGTGKKSLHFFFLLDYSGSMDGAKLGALNQAIHAAVPEMLIAAENEIGVQVYVRAIKFESHATWHVREPIPLEHFTWQDIYNTGALTAMGGAIRLLNGVLREDLLGKRNLPPVIVLITDGIATDDVDVAIAELLANPWGKKAVRMAIGIGEEYDREQLLRFLEGDETFLIDAKRPQDLAAQISWATTTAISVSSQSKKVIEIEDDEFMEESPIEVPADDQTNDIYGETSEELF